MFLSFFSVRKRSRSVETSFSSRLKKKRTFPPLLLLSTPKPNSRNIGSDLGPQDHRRGQPGRALLPAAATLLLAFRRRGSNVVIAVVASVVVVNDGVAAEDGGEALAVVRHAPIALCRRHRRAAAQGRSLGAPAGVACKGRREHAARVERRRRVLSSSLHARR